MTRFVKLVVVLGLSLMGLGAIYSGNAESVRGDAPYTHRTTSETHKLATSDAALATEPTTKPRKFRRGQKFVEFHGELNYFPGNTSLIYGTLGPDGNPLDYQYVSFEAAGGVIGLVVSTFIPWPSYFDGYSWDKASEPVNRYRVLLTEAKFQKLHAFVEESRQTRKVFWLYTENCVRFARDAARVVGLKAPEGTLVLPPVYINMLSYANRGRIADY